MSATSQMAAMLNELMGTSRNAEIGKCELLHFTDECVCKYFLAGFCPHDLFTNTRVDLGPCKLVHDEELRRAYQASASFERLSYERRFLKHLLRLQSDMKRKIERHEERLALTQTILTPDNPAYEKVQEKLANLDKDIEDLQNEANAAGAAGEVEKAQGFIERAERLIQERAKTHAILSTGEPARGKTMEVCKICGCFMNVGETPQRLEEHLNGRQHVGYAKIAAAIEELTERLKKIDGDEPMAQEKDTRHGHHYEEHRRGHYVEHRRGHYEDHRRSHYGEHRRGQYDGRRRSHYDEHRRGHYEDRRRSHYDSSRHERRYSRPRSPLPSEYIDSKRGGYRDSRSFEDRRGEHRR